ncbi:MAG: hypothetical protein GVY15_03160 [Bacteroidetes bacterium]|jgi:hypothetical protein|nr:hypothetical protein [Bacteroidota bacterium]
MTRLLLCLLVALTLVACGTDAGDTGFTLDERDGATYAINSATTVWTPDDAPLQFELEQTFGVADAPEEAMLAGTSSVVVDDEGVVYLLDRGNHRLVAFNPDGTVRWSQGREGEGPGEFQNAFGLAPGPEGDLLVVNQSGQRWERWSFDGELLESYDASRIEGGGFFMNPIGFHNRQLVASSSARNGEPQRFMRVDLDALAVADTLFARPIGFELPEFFGYGGSTRLAGDRLWVADATSYILEEYTLNGQLVRQIERTDEDRLVPPGVYAGEQSARMSSFSRLSTPLRLDDHLLVHSYWPTNLTDPDAHVRRQARDQDVPEVTYDAALDLFTAEGQLRGRIHYEGMQTAAIGRPMTVGPDGKLYTTTTDPFPQVRRYAIHIE